MGASAFRFQPKCTYQCGSPSFRIDKADQYQLLETMCARARLIDHAGLNSGFCVAIVRCFYSCSWGWSRSVLSCNDPCTISTRRAAIKLAWHFLWYLIVTASCATQRQCDAKTVNRTVSKVLPVLTERMLRKSFCRTPERAKVIAMPKIAVSGCFVTHHSDIRRPSF